MTNPASCVRASASSPAFTGRTEGFERNLLEVSLPTTSVSSSDLWKRQREAEEAQTCAFIVDYNDGDNAYYIECKRASVHGSWDGPTKFDPASFGDEAAMTEEIRAFCELLGIKFQEPGWYLSANFS